VIRNRFRTVEGDPFNPREIRESAERIRALGFFSKSDVAAREGSSSEQVIVDVNVEEQPTGSLSFGLSYSVASGAAYAINFKETNFLGRGQTLAFSFDTGSSAANSSLTFVEPAFLGRDLAFRTNAFYTEYNNDFARYSTRLGGVSVGLDFPAGENSRLGVAGGLRFDSLFDVSAESSAIIAAEEAIGDRYLGFIGTNYTYDLRGGGLDPNRGVLLRFGNELYGGDASYLKSSFTAVAETRVWHEEVGLRASLEGGMINVLSGQSRVTDRFFGSEMRGFEPRGIGPRDLNTENLDPLGGNYFAVAKFEAGFPLGLPEEYGITGGVFLDVGSVWGLDDTNGGSAGACLGGAGACPVDDGVRLRAAAGFSIFWVTALGPLRFNFSRPLIKEAYDKEQNFDLTISTKF
jgi:outer membrane protein insertion porin family